MGDQAHLFASGERRKQAGRLVDDADVITAQPGAFGVGQVGGLDARHGHLSGVGTQQQGGDGEQGGLTRTGGAGERHNLAGFDAQ